MKSIRRILNRSFLIGAITFSFIAFNTNDSVFANDKLVEDIQEKAYVEYNDGVDEISDYVDTISPVYAKSVLDDYSKIRDAIVAAVANGATSVDVVDYNLTVEQGNLIRNAFGNSYPEYFYVNLIMMYYPHNNKVTSFAITYNDSPEKIVSMRNELQNEINAFKAGIDSGWTELEKVIYLNSYLAKHCAYDSDFNNVNGHNVYGCLVMKDAVCDGYSKTVNLLCRELGIDSVRVVSNDANHAWNMVKVNGKAYFLDVTWDDPVADMIGRADHTDFLKSYSYFCTTKHLRRTPCDWIVEDMGWNVTDATDTYYDEYGVLDSVTTGFVYAGNHTWYGSYYDETSKNAYIAKYICDGRDMVLKESIVSIGRWHVWGKNSYWVATYAGVGKYSGKILYSTPTKIFMLGSDTPVYELPDVQKKTGYIYGMKIEGDVLTYELSSSPSSSTFNKYTLSLRDLCGEYKTDAEIGIINGWVFKNNTSYWYEGGLRQGTYDDANGVVGDGTIRGREIYDPLSNGWYWLDACYDGAKAVNKEVWMPYIYQGNDAWSDNEIAMNAANSGDMANQVIKSIKERTGKWVRYDADGKMYKGWYTVEGSDAALYPSQVGNTYYYDPMTGLMAKGKVTIGGKTYNFDEVSGALIK